ncbi:MAG: DUF4345 domain-containing protein [Xanthomonadales bacterium]|nr:DUF4345 domain-containing protein [Xanthomonadales bacterium]
MIYDDFIRQILLAATGGIFIFFALWAIVKPDLLASMLGYELKTKSAFSEFHAIYVGVFIAQALLCALAFTRIEDAIIGDLVAVFLLAQPVGRLIAGLRRGFPSGFMQVLFAMELVGGIVLLLVRPSI